MSAAAAGASARGARAEAVVLGEQALRLTPADGGDHGDRLLSLAEYLERAGERQRVTDLVAPALESLPHGRQRARAWLLLSEGGTVDSHAERARHYAHALAESTGDPDLSARVLAMQAFNDVIVGVERIREASALPDISRAGPHVERLTLCVLAWARCLRGQRFDDVCERFRASSHGAVHLVDSPEPVMGLRLSWRGEMDQARATTTRFLSLADERGEAVSYTWLRLNLCGLELRAGRWAAAAQLLDEWAESSDRGLLSTPAYQYNRALLAAGRGRSDEVERWATPALADAEARGYRWHALEARRALGTAALLAHDPVRAADMLRPVWEHTVREGIDEPGAFPVAGDLVEALVELGERSEALAVTERLIELSEQQQHPWGLATAKRCGATVQLKSGASYDGAAAALDEAAAAFGRLGLRVRPGALAARTGPSAAPAEEVARRTGRTRMRRRDVRRARVRRVGRSSALRARARERATPTTGRRVDADRGARRAPGGRRPLQQGDREGAVRDGAHRRSASVEGVRETRHTLAHAARGPPPLARERLGVSAISGGRGVAYGRRMNLLAVDDLRAINAQFIDNFVTNDVAAHDALLHPSFLYVRSDGSRVDRATYLEGWATGFDPEVIVYWDVRDELITVVGDVALVRSTNKETVRQGGEEVTSMSTYTDTYVFEDGRWLCVQAQITPVTQDNEPADDTIISVWIKGVRQP